MVSIFWRQMGRGDGIVISVPTITRELQMVNARDKGKRGENEVCNILTDCLGHKVTRNLEQTRNGGEDIILGNWSIECKRTERVNLPAYWRQATENARARKPAVVLRWSRGEWLAVVRLTDWIELAREDIVETVITASK